MQGLCGIEVAGEEKWGARAVVFPELLVWLIHLHSEWERECAYFV